MREELKKKIEQSIKLLKMVGKEGGVIEVAYSGGKDSDVILQLAKESGINYKAIYKQTTIDPKGTIKHVRDMGVEIVYPKNGLSFFKLIERSGLPTRMRRFCCEQLKEYKVLDKSIIGVRKSESTKRSKNYNEPTECRFYGSKKEHVEAIYPLLDWTDDDVKEFLEDRGIKVAPIYYDENGDFCVERRLGCMCCPLKSRNKRIADFKLNPRMVYAYLKPLIKYKKTHIKEKDKFENAYEHFVYDIFYDNYAQFKADKYNLFDTKDKEYYKQFLEKVFNCNLNGLAKFE